AVATDALPLHTQRERRRTLHAVGDAPPVEGGPRVGAGADGVQATPFALYSGVRPPTQSGKGYPCCTCCIGCSRRNYSQKTIAYRLLGYRKWLPHLRCSCCT